MQNAQVVQCHWDLEVSFAIATTMRGERDDLNKDPVSSVYLGLFQPCYIIFQIATSLNILFIIIRSTTMCLHAKQSQIHSPQASICYKTQLYILKPKKMGSLLLCVCGTYWDSPPRNTSVLSQDIQNIMRFGCCPITCLETEEEFTFRKQELLQ